MAPNKPVPEIAIITIFICIGLYPFGRGGPQPSKLHWRGYASTETARYAFSQYGV